MAAERKYIEESKVVLNLQLNPILANEAKIENELNLLSECEPFQIHIQNADTHRKGRPSQNILCRL